MNVRLVSFIALTAQFCCSCASVDQYGTRIADGNSNAQLATNQEVLLNIVRASQFQSLVWTPVNQFSGGQTESLNATLPTFFFGPHQPAADHIYSLATALNSQVSGNYQGNPIFTSAFQQGMLSPVSLRTVAILTTLYPREIVFYALIQSVTITAKSSGNSARLINDPEQNYIQSPNEQIDPSDLTKIKNNECNAMVERNKTRTPLANISDGVNCTYSKFKNFIAVLLENGFDVELLSTADASAKPASPSPQTPGGGQSAQGSSGGQSSPNTIGKLCFTAAKSASSFLKPLKGWECSSSSAESGKKTSQSISVTDVVTTKTPTGTEVITTQTTKPAQNDTGSTVPLEYYNNKIGVYFELRSPAEFISYLGLWLKYGGVIEPFKYRTFPAQRVLGDHGYLEIGFGAPLDRCYTAITYQGSGYCVPQDATHTAMLMDLAEVLRNLNITPSDLNAPITVRLTQ